MLFAPIAKAGMLIRKPVSEVFEAVVNPDIATRFWFSKSTGRLEPGKQIRWEWETYDVAAQVRVRELEKNRRLLMEWSAFGAPNADHSMRSLRCFSSSRTRTCAAPP